MKDRSRSCGLFGWRPQWLQKYAQRKYYMVLYSFIGIIQGMLFSYLTVVLSTIEKRFGLKSKEAAWIYSGNEISQIFFIVFLPFVGRVKRRPLYLAIATAISALGLIIIGIPHFTGDQHYLLSAKVFQNKSDDTSVCFPDKSRVENCDNNEGRKDWASMWVVFFGIFLLGIASSLFFTFGVSYLDDNSDKENSPFYMGMVFGIRTLGPAFGYLLGSACLTLYADPKHLPEGMAEGNPGWVGAWWMGFFIIGGLLALVSPWLAFFPAHLSDENIESEKTKEEAEPSSVKEWLYEILVVNKRLFSKPIFVCNTLATTVFILGIVGYFTFLPKFFEYHFRQKASKVGAVGGLTQSLASALGIMLSGYLMKRFKIRARPLAAWCCFGEIIFICAFIVIAVMRCPPLIMHGHTQLAHIDQLSNTSCNSNCDCLGVKYQPICSRDGLTNFFSPCHAGCRAVNRTEVEGTKKTLKMFWDCSCVASQYKQNSELTIATPWWKELKTSTDESTLEMTDSSSYPGEYYSSAVDGYCPVDCQIQFYSLLGFMFAAGLISSSTRLPNMMLSMRTVDKRDKSAFFTISLFVFSLFAILPSPLIMGAVMDETCLVWGKKCGQTTNCLVYDTDKMRLYLVLVPGICTLITLAFDIGVWYYAKDLELYSEENGAIKEKEKVNESKELNI